MVDSIIGTAVKYGKKLFGKGAAWVKSKAKQAKDWGKKKLDQGKAWAKKKLGKTGTWIAEKLGLVKAKKPFSMPEGSHTLTGTIGPTGVSISIASVFEGELLALLARAIESATERHDPLLPALQSTANAAKAVRQKLQTQYGSATFRMKQIGAAKVKVTLEHAIEAELTTIILPLSQIAGFEKLLAKVPERRKLPDGFDVRARLYEAGSSWSTAQKAAKAAEAQAGWVAEIDQLPYGTPDELTKSRAKVLELIAEGLLPKGSETAVGTPSFTSKTVAAAIFTDLYHVDHKKALATYWKNGDNNQSDQVRWAHATTLSNLDVRTAEYNTAKGSKDEANERATYSSYFWVGPEFTSVYAEAGRRGARTIDGAPFGEA